jgi:DNA-binding NtrC family response regulator
MILIVEADPAQRRLIADALARAGLAHEAVASAAEAAARLARRAPDAPTLAALDIDLPGEEALALLRRLRADRPDLPILALSARASVARAVAAMRAGADDVLLTPLAPERLARAVREALTRARAAARPAASPRAAGPDALAPGPGPALAAAGPGGRPSGAAGAARSAQRAAAGLAVATKADAACAAASGDARPRAGARPMAAAEEADAAAAEILTDLRPPPSGADGAPASARSDPFAGLVAVAEASRAAVALARRAADAEIPVLFLGESGVGKEVFARALHAASRRAAGPFVAVNCGALPEGLVESILFGHEKGAFTGATERRAGRFAEAQGGALFLDEVGELPPPAQVKLLRALQEREIDPVGAARPRAVDIRVLAATNRDLRAEIAAGRFREDLYWRLAAFPIPLPPLRARRADIPQLADRLLARLAAAEGRPAPALTPDAAALIAAADWPGNVRALENALHRAMVLAGAGPLEAGHFDRGAAAAETTGAGMAPESGARAGTTLAGSAAGSGAAAGTAPAGPEAAAGAAAGTAAPGFGPDGHVLPLAAVEAAHIRRALAFYRGRMAEAARRLGVGRSTLYRRLAELGLAPPPPR